MGSLVKAMSVVGTRGDCRVVTMVVVVVVAVVKLEFVNQPQPEQVKKQVLVLAMRMVPT
jgi:hypothetical protein